MRFPTRHKLPEIDDYLELSFNQFKIIGRSIAGVETVYSIPQWNLTMDTGRAPHFAFGNDYLALSHWHLDHAGGVAYYLGLRCLNALVPVHIIVPDAKLAEAKTYLQELKTVSEVNIQYELHSAKDRITLKNNLFIESIPSYHSTVSTGYGIMQKKHVLKEEFRGKSEDEIIRAKQSGKKVDVEEEIMLLAYSGDSRSEFFETRATQAKVLLMECSFFSEDGNYEKIRDYGHTHLKDWVRYADQIQNETVIMTHTSQRYTKKEIEEYCRKSLPKSLTDRLIIFR